MKWSIFFKRTSFTVGTKTTTFYFAVKMKEMCQTFISDYHFAEILLTGISSNRRFID